MYYSLSSIGPGGDTKLIITPSLSDLMLSHVKYQSLLSIWKKYLIWLYTMGSGPINRFLIGVSTIDTSIQWTYRFFSYYNVQQYSLEAIENPFRQWLQYFISPADFFNLPTDQQILITNEVLYNYIKKLQHIILKAPLTDGPITVYKASTPYEGLPDVLPPSGHAYVYQNPFNSTSYDPQLNFAPFTSLELDCCFFLLISPGVHMFY